ncbi:MAG TPA: hypothetical protein VLA29_00350 [Acidimicrobiia bacterium]|nr:hypothetical protein [Acidimicrobiia bacterium]
MAFEVVEYCEPTPEPGMPYPGTSETILGEYERETEAIAAGRARWAEMRASNTRDVMWWIVRVPGETLARWIADRSSAQEQVLDLRTGELVVVKE